MQDGDKHSELHQKTTNNHRNALVLLLRVHKFLKETNNVLNVLQQFNAIFQRQVLQIINSS